MSEEVLEENQEVDKTSETDEQQETAPKESVDEKTEEKVEESPAKEEVEETTEKEETLAEAPPDIEDETEKEFLASVKEDKKEEVEIEKEEPKLSAGKQEASASVEEKEEDAKEDEEEEDEHSIKTKIFALRTTANREDQVMDFISSNVTKKKIGVYSIIRPHGMRGYIFLEADKRIEAEQSAFNVPYARGVLPNEIQYQEIEHMLEQVKKEVNIQKNDIVELISGPFKREKAKVSRIDKTKEEVVVELLEAAVPIPITVKLDAVKVIRRETEEGEEAED